MKVTACLTFKRKYNGKIVFVGEDPEVAEARREAEERRKEKHRKMEEEREEIRQGIRDKVLCLNSCVGNNQV